MAVLPTQPIDTDRAGPVLAYSPVEIPENVTGITVAQLRPDVRAIYVPALKNWRSLRPALLVTTALSTGVVALLFGCLLFGRARPDEAAGMFVDPGAIALICWLYCLDRLHRRTGFEISPYSLQVTTAGPFGISRIRWSRSRIADVHVNPYNHKLVVRLVKESPAEVFVTTDPEKTRQVVDEISSALGSIPAAPKDRQQLQAAPSAGMHPSPVRTILQRTGLVISVAAFAGIPFTGGFSLLALLPAGILFGIALGTQTNKTYF